jgi:hypothetical protein
MGMSGATHTFGRRLVSLEPMPGVAAAAIALPRP